MNQHQILKKYITGLNEGLATSLICVSPAGYGKTELTLKTMEELGLVEDRNYLYYSNYLTPLTLFQVLDDINHLEDPKILILDDVESTLQDKKIVGLLKSALWETPNGERKVCWLSNTHLIKAQTFNFTGRIIFLLNEINKKSAIVNALKDRSLFYEMELTKQEITNLILERVKQPYFNTSYQQRIKVAEFITQNGNNITLRTFPHALNLMLLSPNHWQELTLKLLTNKS